MRSIGTIDKAHYLKKKKNKCHKDHKQVDGRSQSFRDYCRMVPAD